MSLSLLHCQQCEDTGVYYDLNYLDSVEELRCSCVAGDRVEALPYGLLLGALGIAIIGSLLWIGALLVIHMVICG